MFRNKKGAFGALGVTAQKREDKLNEATRAYFADKVAGKRLVRTKSPQANLRLSYRKALEISTAAALVLLIVLAQIARQIPLAAQNVETVDVKIEVADIPPTEQLHRPPPPPRPSIPIPTESEDIPEDLTIASSEIDLSDLPPPPAPPEGDEVPIFVAYDEPPKIVGGMQALTKHLRYPRLAQASGVEGVVFVKVLVGIDGKTQRTEVIRAKPANMGFEESAIKALQKVKWQPAKQRDREIRVWVSIPVQFKLVSS